MANPSSDAEYPIAAVSKLTGISCHALRVWERRYGFPLPHRTVSGHRRYSIEQVLTLRHIAELARNGRPISELIAEVRVGLSAHEHSPTESPSENPVDESEIVEFMDELFLGNFQTAETSFGKLAAILGVDDLIARVIAPALTETGERWFRRKCSIYQERCVSGFLRLKLDILIDAARRANTNPSRTIIMGSLQGDRHEGGIMIVHLMMERAGWRVISLGADLPVTEYEKAIESLHPDALALSFVLSRNINKRFQELKGVRGLPVFVGGRSILNYQSLARRHGLIPLPGPVSHAIDQMRREFDLWAARGS